MTLSSLISFLFNVTPIFTVEQHLSTVIAASVTPVLLLIAIYLRVVETQVDAITTGGKWAEALKDILLWSAVLGSYYAIGNLVIHLANPIYAWFDGQGSLNVVMKTFADLKAANAKNLNSGSALSIVGGSVYVLVSGFLYYLTLAVMSFIAAFLTIAHAILYGVALCWGLIAIPISITKHLRILRGWAYLVGLAIAWPIIQGIAMALFTGLFVEAARQLQATQGSSLVQLGDLQMLFAILHLLFCAVLVSAPLLADRLISNTPSGMAAVGPFVGAAIAAGVGTARATHGASTRGAAAAGAGMGAVGGRILGGLRNMSDARAARPATGVASTPNAPSPFGVSSHSAAAHADAATDAMAHGGAQGASAPEPAGGPAPKPKMHPNAKAKMIRKKIEGTP